MPATVVIPARFASSRFPAKMIADETGRPLVQHVADQVLKCRRVGRVIVAADDKRIVEALRPFRTECVMTAASHQSGTDRIAEVVRGMEDGIIVNVQGDEPEIEPEVVDGLIAAMEDGAWDMATAATEFPLGADAGDPNLVKVVMGMDGRALYFSRSAIPFHRDVVLSGTDGASRSTGVSPVVMAANTGETPVLRTPPKTSAGGLAYYLHLGIYAYRRAFLLEFAAWAPTPLESAEKLEQLRVLEHGRPIFVLKVKRASHGIDTPGQYADFVRRHRAGAGPARARSELR